MMSIWSAYDPYDPTQPQGDERECHACGIVVTNRDQHNLFHDYIQQMSRYMGQLRGEDMVIDPPPPPPPQLTCANGHTRKDLGETEPLCRRCFEPMTPVPEEPV
jgi:hypothetical protein